MNDATSKQSFNEDNSDFDEAIKSLKRINYKTIIEPFSEKNEKIMNEKLQEMKTVFKENTEKLGRSVISVEAAFQEFKKDTIENTLDELSEEIENKLNEIYDLKVVDFANIEELKKISQKKYKDIDNKLIDYIENERINHLDVIKKLELQEKNLYNTHNKTLEIQSVLKSEIQEKYKELDSKIRENIENEKNNHLDMLRMFEIQEKQFINTHNKILGSQTEIEKNLINNHITKLNSSLNDSNVITKETIDGLIEKQASFEIKCNRFAKILFSSITLVFIIQVITLIMMFL
ncbi:MAG TPA: hypothetical protein DCO67_06450 [Staphylococcus sp.]|nr:hypothetical protein [Staphylococcus sp.]